MAENNVNLVFTSRHVPVADGEERNYVQEETEGSKEMEHKTKWRMQAPPYPCLKSIHSFSLLLVFISDTVDQEPILVDFGQEAPVNSRAQPTIHILIYSYGQFSGFNQPNMHTFQMWDKTGIPAEKPCKHGDKKIPHSRASAGIWTQNTPCRASSTFLF